MGNTADMTMEARFHITYGNEGISRDPRNVIPASLNYGMYSSTAFTGRCYACRQPGHSQKWCPLRKCRRCGEYGHTYDTMGMSPCMFSTRWTPCP